MKFSIILRFLILGALWVLLCYMYVAAKTTMTLLDWFWLLASFVIIFAPMYKKYVGNNRKK